MSSQPHPVPGPGFDEPIPPGGYRWWHVDAESDDGRQGITVAACLGAPAGVGGTEADPLGCCAMLACLRGRGRPRWSMTRRGGAEIMRWPQALVVGLNTLFRSATTLSFGIDDVTAPWPARLRGVIHVHLSASPARGIALDPGGLHRWRPLAARARVRVAMERPACAWEGHGWCDSQEGDAPLDVGFAAWSRARAHLGGTAVVAQAFRLRGGEVRQVVFRVDEGGAMAACQTGHASVAPTRWRLPRCVPADRDAARVIGTLADTPLYARTLVEAPLFGEPARILHETLSFERLRRPWGRLLLAMRTPRAWT